MADARIELLPPGVDLSAAAARRILERHGDRRPDLSGVTLLVPHPALSPGLLRALTRAAGGALLAPRLLTLAQLAAPAEIASPLACRLRLAEAVARFRFLFPGQTPLRVADALYALFEELEEQHAELPDDEAALEALLRTGYGADRPLAALSREAQIVHRLHRAFREELGARAPAVARRQALTEALAQWPEAAPLWLIGFDELTPAEAAALAPRLRCGELHWLGQGRLQGRDGVAMVRLFARLGRSPAIPPMEGGGRSRLLDAALDPCAAARDRALALGQVDAGDLALVEASDTEHEAQIADLAVREALLAGARHVAVVCDDRRLARRLRARLERAGLRLADRSGWALSTSRAAAALDAWMSCLDADFPFRALFAVLKSGFLDGGAGWAEQLEPRAQRQRIAGGAGHWRTLMDGPAERRRWDRLADAARRLDPGRGPLPAAAQAEALLDSLDRSGLAAGLAIDAAGARLLERLRELREALAGTGLKPGWPAFRALVDAALEDASFSTGDLASPVQLLTLAQTPGLAADAVILTGAGPALLADSDRAPFFNRGVRRELGLPTAAERQALALTRLRNLLDAAPRVRVVYAPGEAGETAQLAPVLAAVAAFATAAGRPLPLDRALAARATLAEIAADSLPPVPVTQAPAPAASPRLVERGLSARGHQTLVDCPYAFHARYALGLERLEAPDAPVDRRDYGDRVHRLLRAFEVAEPGLPPPWTGPRDAGTEPEVVRHLHRLADAIFAGTAPLERLWRAEFGEGIPWLAEKLCEWPRAQVGVEQALEAVRDGWRLRGIVDRLEDEGSRRRLIDHKTGSSPSRRAMLAGEAVQLTHYALLTGAGRHRTTDDSREAPMPAGPSTAIEYWNLKEQKAQGLDGQPLQELAVAVAGRLQTLSAALHRGAALPAHGAEPICERCEFHGICRRGDWANGAGEVAPATSGSPRP